MSNPDSHIIHRDEYKINYMTNTLQDHRQHLRVEERATTAATSTTSAPTVNGTAFMTTLSSNAPFSYNPEEPSIFL